jgi:hypothetical protein
MAGGHHHTRLFFFFHEMGFCKLFSLGWPGTEIFLMSVSCIAWDDRCPPLYPAIGVMDLMTSLPCLVLEILGCCHVHKSDTCSKADGQSKIYFWTRVYLWRSQAGEYTRWEVHLVFLSHASLPLTLMDGFGSTVFMNAYLEKWACVVRWTLKQGE